jgi:hypothetical protein
MQISGRNFLGKMNPEDRKQAKILFGIKIAKA